MTTQPGQLTVSPLSTGPNKIPFDNGGPQVTSIQSSGGTVTLNGATLVAVANANVTANSSIILTLKTIAGPLGAAPQIKTITPGTGFSVSGTAADLSVYNYLILG